jgi:uncharacterized protein (DUF4415 family)
MRKIPNPKPQPGGGMADLEFLANQTEEEIEADALADLENPPWTDEDFKNAIVVEPNGKTAISIRLDADIVMWFRSQGPRYQTRMNSVLRSYYNAARRKEKPAPKRRKKTG